MKINVTENKVSIKEEQILNENEYNIHKIQFDFSSEYTDDLVKIALFSIDNHTYKKIISNNECDIPPEVLTQRGYSILGVYAYKTEQDTLVLRYSPSPTKISVYDGSYKADAENSEPITPSEIEQYQQILQNSLQQFQNQYNALVEETEGDIQTIEDELQRKVDEGYFDGEDGFSPIAKVIQKSNGATIEIEDKNGKTTADVLNGEDGYTPVRGVDYWTEEDKQEVEEEATQQIEGKIEEYNENAAEKLNQYNQNSVQKTNDYNTNASQKVESFNTNASSKLSEYNSNAETKKSAYDENATQKTNSFNTNATNKLTEYNTNHTEKMNTYNNNSTQKLNAFNENATQKTEDFDEHTEEIQDNIEILQRTDNQILSRFNKDEEVSGQDITLTGTTEIKFAKPPLPMGNSEQFTTTGKNLAGIIDVMGNHISKEEDKITYSSGAYASDFVNLEQKELEANQEYIFEMFLVSKSNNTNPVEILIKDSENVNFFDVFKNIGGNTTYYSQSFTPTTVRTLNKLQLYCPQSAPLTGDVVFRFQIRKANTSEGYEIYTNGVSPNPDYPQEITNVTGDVEVKVQNKNLFDINSFESQLVSGKIINDNGVEVSDATSTYSRYKLFLRKNVTYYIKGAWQKIYYYDMNGNLKSRSSAFNGADRSYTPSENEYIGFQIGNTYWSSNKGQEQIEQNSTSTNFVEHKEQTFTFPLSNEKLMLGDYLADDGIHKNRKKIVLDGTSENKFSSFSTGANNRGAIAAFSDIKKGVDFRYNTALCTNFAYVPNVYFDSGDTEGFIVDSTGTIYVRFGSQSEINTLAKANQWLANTLPELEYELAEETIIPYTPAQQEVYNQINNAYSYDEMTIITGSSDGNKPFFTVQAYKDLNKELNNKVDKVQGKELSSNDFTDTLKEKLEGLENYDDTEIKADISGKQDITDNTLTTINKTVPTAINEVNSIAKLANQAKSYPTYQALINYLNTAEKTEFIPGQSFMIQTKLVPDLWVYSVENTSVQYTYTTDEDFITYTNQATGGQVGYYKLAQLETQKVDLTNYVTFDDYATSTTVGVVKTSAQYGVSTSSYTKNLTGATRTYAQYQSGNDVIIICKGTLENVITGKNLESANNKTTTISSSSTDNEYPSAKAVYDYIQSILNNGSN